VLTVLVPVVLVACTAGPSDRPAVVENDGPPPQEEQATAGLPVPLPPLTEPRDPSINWADCDQETRERLGSPGVPDSLHFTCAKIAAKLDAPDLPSRGLTRIAVTKVGTGTIPLVVVNDIDGEPGTLYAARLAATLPPPMLAKFSLIGVDRRGSGLSNPVGCVPPEVREQLLSQDPASGDSEPVLDAARKAGQQCTIDLANQQQAIDSWRAAGDLDEVRDQLGIPKLNALSHGEGSKVLAAYATRYAPNVGRLVLDGVPDPNPDATSVLDGVAAGAESTLDDFGVDCARRGCSMGGDAKATVLALLDQLRSAPPILPDGTEFGPGPATYAVAEGLAQPSRWAELANAIVAARSGNMSGLAAFSAPLTTGTPLLPSRLDATLVTKCNDTATRLPADRINAALTTLRGKYPVFGGLVGQQLAWCSPWPVRREPLPPPGGPGDPPILVTSTAIDPVTPEAGTARAAEQMPSAVRLAWQGAGHGALASPCIADEVQGFLVDGKVPTDGQLCPA
jgi:pimeloyl-ACP methyl ester carboxylesterase